MRSQRQAEQVEAWVHDQALQCPQLIDALIANRFSLRAAWIAKLRGTLDDLIAGIEDPLLEVAVEKYRSACADTRARAGLGQLLEYADEGVRLSWLAGTNIRDVYQRALGAGRKPNSVRRSLHRAVSELLAHHLGEERRAKAFTGVKVPSERDERTVRVTPDEVRAVLEACVPESFRWFCVAAISTAVDRGPLLAITPREFAEAAGTLAVPDLKTPDRLRILRLSSVALLALRVSVAGKRPAEQLWPWTESQVRHMWEAARDKASGRPTRWMRARRGRGRKSQLEPLPDPIGERALELLRERRVVTLPILRLKDLRHLLPTTLAALGVDRKEIQAVIGHAPGSNQTDRYITPVGDVEWLNRAADALGLGNVHLRAVGE